MCLLRRAPDAGGTLFKLSVAEAGSPADSRGSFDCGSFDLPNSISERIFAEAGYAPLFVSACTSSRRRA